MLSPSLQNEIISADIHYAGDHSIEPYSGYLLGTTAELCTFRQPSNGSGRSQVVGGTRPSTVSRSSE